MIKFFPIVTGLFLGTVSIVIGQIPTAVAQFSGMTVLGNHIGYLWGVLIVSWVFHEKWIKSFISSFLSMIVANLAYYLSIVAFYVFNIGRSPFPPTPLQSFYGFVQWSIISAFACILAATAVWMARQAKFKLFNYGIFAVSYLGLLGLIYSLHVLPAINWYEVSRAGDFFVVWRFVGHLFEVGFAFAITSILLGIGLKNITKK